MIALLEQARRLLLAGEDTCVLVTAEGRVLRSRAQGVRPVIGWLRENPALLRGAVVADRVLGRAAAMLFACGGVSALWGQKMSDAAADFLTAQGIAFACAERVPQILNREGTAMCPMERAALDCAAPEVFAAHVGVRTP